MSTKDEAPAPPRPPKPSDDPRVAQELRQKLVHARARLLLRFPFFGYLVSNLEDKLGADWKATVGTDGTAIHWRDEFLQSLAPDDVMFVLAHEAMHCALQHLWRRGERDKRNWNLATDACVNDMLIDAGLASTLPLLRGAKGKSAEEMYEEVEALLKANAAKGTVDDHDEWNEEGDAEEPADRTLADAWRAALAQAKSFGNVPDGMGRLIDSILEPRKDWRDLLRAGLFFPEDYRWVPTDRRFPDVLLPTLAGEVHRVVVAIDTSGSIVGDKLTTFWSELVAILRNNRCEARVLTCDAEVQDEWDETQFDPAIVTQLRGGGGTSFVPVFERVERYVAAGWRPEAVVYLTDLDGQFPSREPEVRTIWVVEKDDAGKKVPFGEVIALE